MHSDKTEEKYQLTDYTVVGSPTRVNTHEHSHNISCEPCGESWYYSRCTLHCKVLLSGHPQIVSVGQLLDKLDNQIEIAKYQKWHGKAFYAVMFSISTASDHLVYPSPHIFLLMVVKAVQLLTHFFTVLYMLNQTYLDARSLKDAATPGKAKQQKGSKVVLRKLSGIIGL
ncbi:hypothetical protein TNCV_1341071 [Trichonephila clavipes]|uniref:Uncharacterized protein n=1 Tax=Trichonephila clavipes TaxID=2585209 RepID=A0A8X6VA37_TRICX|nr:hypothetical protein TNCV_1341071 [Trichonephila clavipes]